MNATAKKEPITPFRHAGLVLAAGASARMGQPKALLKTPAGIALAQYQAQLLEKAGCAPVLVVLGCDYERIQPRLPDCRVVVNPEWERGGRFSSVQAGLRAAGDVDGCIILPVDTVGIRLQTIETILRRAEELSPPALRPVLNGKPGQVAWISGRLKEVLLTRPAGDEARLDELLLKVAEEMDCKDPAILRNVNTPEEWARVQKPWPV